MEKVIEKRQTTRRHIKLGFSNLDTIELVTELNRLLANYAVHYQKLRNFHWNIQGSDFFELHDKFEEIYGRIGISIDVIAERIRVFDKTPYSTMSEFIKSSEIEEPPYGYSSYEMVKDILNDFEVLLTKQNNVMDSALNIGDSGTIDIVNRQISDMEKDFWMLSSWLKNA